MHHHILLLSMYKSDVEIIGYSGQINEVVAGIRQLVVIWRQELDFLNHIQFHLFIREPVQKARVDTTNKAAKLKKKTVKVKAPTKVIKFIRRK